MHILSSFQNVDIRNKQLPNDSQSFNTFDQGRTRALMFMLTPSTKQVLGTPCSTVRLDAPPHHENAHPLADASHTAQLINILSSTKLVLRVVTTMRPRPRYRQVKRSKKEMTSCDILKILR